MEKKYTYTSPNDPVHLAERSTDNPVICRWCGSHVGNHKGIQDSKEYASGVTIPKRAMDQKWVGPLETSPCLTEGHAYQQAHWQVDIYGEAHLYCTKCADMKTIKF